MRKGIIILFTLLSIALPLWAEIIEPVSWNVEMSVKADSVEVTIKAVIDDGWHLYATQLPPDGPKSTTISVVSSGAVSLPSLLVTGKQVSSYDENFMMELDYFEHEVIFSFTLPQSSLPATLEVEYMACNDISCLPPTRWTTSLNTPLQPASGSSLWWIFLMGLLGGLLAIFTPCVWPIIPMTVSFFLKRGEKSNAVRDALLYGLSIIVIYVSLGLLVTLIFGASALNDISTNAVVNLLFFALLVVFALSFFGAFELTLPASWSTALDKRARTTSGILSILLMAFTLVIVSFSCTGPIIGTLLVEAAGRSLLAPAVGMLGFAIALALPFSLFALFPNWLKTLPRSGGWMDSFKIVLAFIELALSLKFFSVADLAYGWHLLDREVFLALWIVIFALLGLYLLGVFHFKHEEKAQGIGTFRLMLAIVSLAFSVYMLPGLWGAPLKAISAFAPPMWTQDWTTETTSAPIDHRVEPQAGEDIDWNSLAATDKPLLLDFSGYGCVNCRKMEAKVLTDERVKQALAEYEVLTLMVDDKQSLDKPIKVEENGKQRTLKTNGDYWSYVQRSRFGANAQPYYVKVDSEGRQIGSAYSYNEDIDAFINWLNNDK